MVLLSIISQRSISSHKFDTVCQQYSDLSRNGTISRLSSCVWVCRLKRICIPVVYAANDSEYSDASPENIGITTVDKLESARPKVVVTEDEVNEFIEKETGRDRVRAMFTKNSNGELSSDLANVVHMAQTTGFLFFLITSVAGGRAARERFLEKNKGTAYATKFRAFRAYNDAIFFGSMRFGIKWGLKGMLFAGMFTLTAQTMTVYRNRTSVFDYVLGGGLTAALLRMNMGLRGMFAGCIIGSGIGLIGGAAMCSLLYLSNETQQHRHFLHIHQILRDKREAEMLSGNIISHVPIVPIASGDIA